MKPNIVFIFSDQQRYDTLGCYGQQLEVTPNIDKLASEGVVFENAFTMQPVCGPARASLQTGKYATEVECFVNGIALPLEEKTMAHYLKNEGYNVGYVGKWHLASDNNNHYETTAVLWREEVDTQIIGWHLMYLNLLHMVIVDMYLIQMEIRLSLMDIGLIALQTMH